MTISKMVKPLAILLSVLSAHVLPMLHRKASPYQPFEKPLNFDSMHDQAVAMGGEDNKAGGRNSVYLVVAIFYRMLN